MVINNIEKVLVNLEGNLSNIRSEINNNLPSGINPLTPDSKLSEYVEKIGLLTAPTISVDQQLLILYGRAIDDNDANSLIKPNIAWQVFDAEKGYEIKITYDENYSEENYKDYWHTYYPESFYKFQNGEHHLTRGYIMFVTIQKDEELTRNSNWPVPICIEGKDGAKGEQGDKGENGIVVGLIQYHAAHLFKVVPRINVSEELNKTLPIITYDYTKINNSITHLAEPNFIQLDGEDVLDSATAGSGWGLSYQLPDEDPENYCILKIVVGYNSNGSDTNVTSPIQLSGEGVIKWTEWYYGSSSDSGVTFDQNVWNKNEIPEDFKTGEINYLWNCTQIEYDSGRVITTDPVLIAFKPNSIVSIVCKYGVSDSVSIRPTKWFDSTPSEFTVLWKQETTTFTVSSPQTIETPIAVKGNPGVEICAWLNSESELENLGNNWDGVIANWDSEEYRFKKAAIIGSDLYIWCGTLEPEWSQNTYNIGNYWWIKIPNPFSTVAQADWNIDDSSNSSFIKNRTHYTYNGVITDNTERDVVKYRNRCIARTSYSSEMMIKSLTIVLETGNEHVLNNGENTITIEDYEYSITLDDSGEITCNNSDNVNFIHSVKNVIFELNVPMKTLSANLVESCLSVDLLKLIAMKKMSRLIPGMTYLFNYNNKRHIVKSIGTSELDAWCRSESGEIKVNWANTMIDHIVISDVNIVYYNSDQIEINTPRSTFCLNDKTNKCYVTVFNTTEYSPDIELSVVLYKDIYGNEYQNPNCSFTNSYNNIVYGPGTVWCVNSDNNTFKTRASENAADVICTNSNNNSVISGSVYMQIENSSGNSIHNPGYDEVDVKVQNCHNCIILPKGNISVYSSLNSSIIGRETLLNHITTIDIDSSGNIDVSGKIESAGGFFKQ